MTTRRRTRERTTTFLLTDIEGSTRALHRLGPRYIDALEEHRQLLRRIASDFGGKKVDSVGGSLLFAFETPKAAAATAVFGQLAFATLRSNDQHAFRVRMGIHTGPIWRRKRRYYGLTLHKVARISGLARGGQVLVSAETAGSLGVGVPIESVGTALLDGFDHPQDIYELRIAPSIVNGAADSPH